MAGIKFDITGDNQNFLSALRGAENGVRSTAKTVMESAVPLRLLRAQVEILRAHSTVLR